MSDLATKNQVAEFYEDFQSRGKYDYFYGDEKRKNLYIQLIGKGNRILEVGCRSGNLTQFYHEGNQVEGIDVDRNALVEFEKRLKLKGYWVDVDSEDLPFDDGTFDVITSSLVLEHVVNPDFYYSEAARLLKPGGVCFFNFPHRLKPYDSHSRCWFIHYFPKNIRKVLWDIFSRQGGDYLNNYLYLRTVSTHKRIAKKYFSYAEDRTGDRIKTINFVNYKGNSKLRIFASKLMSLKYVGYIFIKIFSINASTDLYLEK